MNAENEFEDPREIAARLKVEQQKLAKERAEAERAARLKAERQYFESKPFSVIYREYSKNPIYAIPRLIRWILAILFFRIPEDTDNPDLKKRLTDHRQKLYLARIEKEERLVMETYYKKYAQTFHYRFLRAIDDYKFQQKRKKERRGKPLPVYHPPERTPEQEKAIRHEMNRLYKKYHVSMFERLRRGWNELQRRMRTKV